MNIIVRFGALAAAALVYIGGAASASAQTSNSMLAPSQVMSRISASDVSAMMTELGVTTELRASSEGRAPVLLAATQGGGKFLFHFFGCGNVAEASGCANTIVTTAFPSAGLSYDDINQFNRDSVVTTGANIGEQQIVILARNIVVAGGHSRELFKGTVYLFLVDVQKFVNQKASATSIGYSPGAEKSSKIDGFASGATRAAATSIFGIEDLSADIGAAIANTNDVDFAVEYEAGGL